MYILLGLHEEEEYENPCDVQSAQSISNLLSRLSTILTWDNTRFLQQAVDAIPTKGIKGKLLKPSYRFTSFTWPSIRGHTTERWPRQEERI